jgi:tetratricopeptide (TPR) repeat protein
MQICAKCWIAWLIAWSPCCPAAPYRPVDPALELAHDLSPYRAALKSAATDLPGAIAQAQSLVNEGRRRADVRAFAYAEKLLAPFGGQVSGNSSLALLLADIRQYRHDFNGAVALLDRLLQREGGNATARLMRAEIRLAQGRGRDALRDCLALIGSQSGIWSVCSAQAYAISGRLADAKRLLATTLPAGPIAGASGAWAAGIMADLAAQSGDPAQEEAWLERALGANRDDHVAAIELIDLWLSSGRSAQALQFMQGRPVSDAYLLRKAEGLRVLDPPQSRAVVADLERRFAEADALGDGTHLRERAQFELKFGRPRAALAHAQENFRTQRELVDLRILLESAAAAEDPAAAADALAWLKDSRAEDARLTATLARLGASPRSGASP